MKRNRKEGKEQNYLKKVLLVKQRTREQIIKKTKKQIVEEKRENKCKKYVTHILFVIFLMKKTLDEKSDNRGIMNYKT